MQSEPPCDVDVKKFLENDAFSAFTIQQIRRMCHPLVEDIEEERDLMNKRKDMEKAFVAYQHLYLSSEIFHEIQANLGSIPSSAILVTQGKELQAFTRHWECILCTSEYFYKPVVESFHNLGFEETSAIDMSRTTNCWVSNTWKPSSFRYRLIVKC